MNYLIDIEERAETAESKEQEKLNVSNCQSKKTSSIANNISSICGSVLGFFCDCLGESNEDRLSFLFSDFYINMILYPEPCIDEKENNEKVIELPISHHDENGDDYDDDPEGFSFESLCDIGRRSIAPKEKYNIPLLDKCNSFLDQFSYDLLKYDDFIWADIFLINKVFCKTNQNCNN